ncbi:MAG: hypothetical protein AVDCRST_MAG28-256 [uncultured Rubrobacteraceae bacterium]|uniref:Uncharacterized protein n=1 Tax=uncultured Rubrobacteraceae bacterium TaxID=349277 RepID=A0A6J4QCI9_9ACTN|nr:MAG: hypothetical protein AVDCRST_MAG28-256 [uncultured Rubrobacteraceae bacterium]
MGRKLPSPRNRVGESLHFPAYSLAVGNQPAAFYFSKE